MRKLILLTGGWSLFGAGAVLSLAPVPVPLIGILPLLTGCAILSSHSKLFRRRMQRLRHRSEFLSGWLERFLHRAPKHVKVMIRRTRPIALHRQSRMRSAGAIRRFGT